MKLNYKLTNRPVITTSQLVGSTLADAMFYLYKEDDVVSYSLEVYNDTLDFSANIYSTENLKTVFKVRANTTDIMTTNVSIDGVPYYYEIKATNNSFINLQDLTLNTEIDAVSLNGKLYTNTYINNYEIKDGTFLYSVAVIPSRDHNVKYYNDDILITVAKKKEDTLYAKTSFSNCLMPRSVNDNTVILPSFYLKTRSKTFQFIEGDVLTVNKRELNRVEGNFVKLKEKATTASEGYLNTNNNVLYLDDYYMVSKDVIVTYTAKRSSHVFEVDSGLFLKLSGNNLIRTVESDCDIAIRRTVDVNRLHLKTNDYLTKYTASMTANKFGFLYNTSKTEAKKKMLTRYLNRHSYKNASEVVYILINDKRIFQEDSVEDIGVDVISKEAIYDYLENDYSLPTIIVENNNLHKKELSEVSKNLFVES